MWRRAVISMAAMLGVSAAFVAVVMLVLGSIVDQAVSAPSSQDKADSVESATSTGAKDAPASDKGPSHPGERS